MPPMAVGMIGGNLLSPASTGSKTSVPPLPRGLRVDGGTLAGVFFCMIDYLLPTKPRHAIMGGE